MKKAVHYRATWTDDDWKILDLEPGDGIPEALCAADDSLDSAEIEILDEVELPEKRIG